MDGPGESVTAPNKFGRRSVLKTLVGGTSGAAAILAGCNTDLSGSTVTNGQVGSTTRRVTLEYMDVSGERERTHFDPVVQHLEAEFDADIELEFVEVPYENFRSTLLTRIGGGNAPDIAAIDQIWLGSLITSGNLLVLDEVADDVDFDDYLDEFAATVQREGHVYGFPIGTDVRGMYWNKSMFEDAGLDPEQPPATWSELIDVAKLVHDPPVAFGSTYFVNAGRWSVSLFSAGGTVLSADGTEPLFHESSGIRAAEFVNRLYNIEDITAPNPSYGNGSEVAREFLQGQYAITTVEGSWLDFFWRNMGHGDRSMVDQFGFAPTPIPDDGVSASMSGGFVWAGFADTEYPEIVREFMRVVNERPFIEQLMVETQDVPTRESLLGVSAIWDNVLYPDAIRELLQQTRLRPVEHWSVVANALDPALQRVAFGEQDAETSLQAAADQVRAELG